MGQPNESAIYGDCPEWCCGDHDDGHVSHSLSGTDREGRPFSVWLERVAGEARTYVTVHVEGKTPDLDTEQRVPVEGN